MLLRAVAPLTLVWAALAHAAPACSQAAPVGASGPSAQPSEVRAWLLRIHDAASRRNFQGTFVVSGAGNVASARISHFCEGQNQYERIESLDGRQRKVYRHNDVVQTVWPSSQVAMVEQRGMLSSFPALLQAISWVIMQRSDVLLLGLLVGTSAAGLYSPVLRVVDGLVLIQGVMTSL